ncbi:TPA: fimbrial protein [Proteus mirabilis]
MSALAATNQGHGKVTFTGEIIDAPCSISSESAAQEVPFGEISNVALAKGGSSETRDFSILLEGCVFPTGAGGTGVINDKVTVTFSGAGAQFDSKLLGVTGLNSDDAKNIGNVGIRISDSNGAPIEMGKGTSAITSLQPGNNELRFSARVLGNDVDVAEIPLGEFSGVTNFTLAYN